MVNIGIDPGKNGGIAVIADDIYVYPYNDSTLQEIADKYSNDKAFCIVEKVGAMPGQGVTSMFNFGKSFGYILGVLDTKNIPYQLVPPRVWKKEFSLSNNKNLSIITAKRLFPGIDLRRTDRCKKEHDGMAEALLMAEYGRRKT